MFKKIIVILIAVLALTVFTAGALADGYWYDGVGWWRVDCSGWHQLYNRPMEFDQTLVNHHFPTQVIRDVSGKCTDSYGTPVGCLGLVSNRGSNLRSRPTIKGHDVMTKDGPTIEDSSIIRKLHANETVYVYFNCYDNSGNEWYYVVCSNGMEGYLFANRIMLISM